MAKTNRVILVGRHAGEIPGVEVVEQVNQVWSLDADEAYRQLLVLDHKAYSHGAALLFQNVPNILAVALSRLSRRMILPGTFFVRLGVIISKPGPHPPGVAHEFQVDAEQADEFDRVEWMWF